MLEPADYLDGFPLLIPLIEKAWGKKLMYAKLLVTTDRSFTSRVHAASNRSPPDFPTRLEIYARVCESEYENPRYPNHIMPYLYTLGPDGLSLWSCMYYTEEIEDWIKILQQKKALTQSATSKRRVPSWLAWMSARVKRLLAGGQETLD